jgi:mannose-6-phosphate isomerase-like protein (cupin superfamily)
MEVKDDQRPWGTERCLTSNEVSTVKLLYVKAGESLSLQLHNHRDEFWKVISGNPETIVGEKTYHNKAGDEISVPRETAHRVSAPEGDVTILEISTGDFDEHDEVRLEDKYNRS